METTPQTPEPMEESIFTESDYSMEGYDKHIRRARNILFVIAGLNLVSIYSLWPIDNSVKYIATGFVVFIAAVFVVLAFWTKKKPYSALLTALILYVGLQIIGAVANPMTLAQGWFGKIIVVVLLILGLQNAKETQQLLKAFGKEEQ